MPHRGTSNEYQQHMLGGQLRKISVFLVEKRKCLSGGMDYKYVGLILKIGQEGNEMDLFRFPDNPYITMMEAHGFIGK